MPVGTYTLLIERTRGDAVEVGALGEVDLPAGWYAYTGSAFGPGGFDRIDRHERVAAGDHDVRHWHVDYLLGAKGSRLDGAVRSVDVDAECAVARRLDGDRVAGFGCSDCRCDSHLVRRPDREPLVESVERAHRVERRAAGTE